VIAVDANGADAGVATVVEGARRAGAAVTLFGPAADMDGAPGEVVDAPLAIGGDEEPAHAVRANPGASIVQAARAVGGGRAGALVSAGPTGAALAASVFHVRRLRGVQRPAVAVLLPVPGHPTLLLDAGANVEVRSDHLVQFALMGAAFMRAVHGVGRPRVGLLSVGEEAGKGRPEVVEAHERLLALAGESRGHEFAGNVEGHEVTAGAVDVVVTDGFTGNVALKLMEGTARTVVGAVRSAISSSPVATLGGLLVRGRLGGLRRELDPNTMGGAVLLGLRRPVVIAHGGSSAEGIANAVRLARRAVDERAVERTGEALAAAVALRSAPAASVEP
jgi:glycerol-3-phosphate acyltransferase PlsX